MDEMQALGIGVAQAPRTNLQRLLRKASAVYAILRQEIKYRAIIGRFVDTQSIEVAESTLWILPFSHSRSLKAATALP